MALSICLVWPQRFLLVMLGLRVIASAFLAFAVAAKRPDQRDRRPPAFVARVHRRCGRTKLRVQIARNSSELLAIPSKRQKDCTTRSLLLAEMTYL